MQCTDGTAAADCIPECSAARHGFILLLNLNGDDTNLSCNLAHGLYSWMGAASEGGYLGADFASFLSAVISGAAGAYIVTLTEDAGIGTDLTIRPGQDVRISADPGLAAAPSWGSGGFTVQERGSLSLTFLAVRGAIGAEQGGASLSLSRCALLPGRDGAADRMLFHDATVRITDTDLGYRGFTSIGGNVVIRSSTTVACTGCLRTLGCVVDTVGASAQSMSGCQPNLIQARDGAHITLAEMEIYPLLLALLKDVSRGQNPEAQNPRVEDTACGNTITFDQVSIIGRPSYGVLTGTLAVGPRGSYDATGQLSITREPPGFLDSTSAQGATACEAFAVGETCDSVCAARGMVCDTVSSDIMFAREGYPCVNCMGTCGCARTQNAGVAFSNLACTEFGHSRRHDSMFANARIPASANGWVAMVVKCATDDESAALDRGTQLSIDGSRLAGAEVHDLRCLTQQFRRPNAARWMLCWH